MIINTFTLIDAFNQFWKVCEFGDRRSLTSAGLTYYHLCSLWNTCGRPVSFRRQNTLICSSLEISKPTLERHRNILKQAGLIDFYSKGKGDPNITYMILDVESSKKTLLPKNEKENNITSDVTTPVTSDEHIKQSIEKDLFVEVNGEVKNFYYLQNLFSQDAGLLLFWKNQGYPAEEFSKGLEFWLIQNHKAKYLDFHKLRNHFLFWIPSYYKQIDNKKQNYGAHKQSHAGNKEKDRSYAGGL